MQVTKLLQQRLCMPTYNRDLVTSFLPKVFKTCWSGIGLELNNT